MFHVTLVCIRGYLHCGMQDMDLLDEKRQLVHSGKLLRQPDGGLEWSGWSELFVLLFDNYCKFMNDIPF